MVSTNEISIAGGNTVNIYQKYYTVKGSNTEHPLSFPVTLINTNPSKPLTILIKQNIKCNNYNDKPIFIIASDNITINGEFKQINIINTTSFIGVVQNGFLNENDEGIKTYDDGFNKINIESIFVNFNNSLLASGAGSVVTKGFANNSQECNICHCFFDGDIPNNTGGIAGIGAADFGNLIVKGCFTSGKICGNGGGIIASDSCNLGNLNVIYCYSLGDIIADYYEGKFGAGGIVGPGLCKDGGNCTIENCYFQGKISYNIRSAGILGYFNGMGKCIISNAYTLYGSIFYKSPENFGKVLIDHTYTANGIWNYDKAVAQLEGSPSNPYVTGKVWCFTIGNNQNKKREGFLLSFFRFAKKQYLTTDKENVTTDPDINPVAQKGFNNNQIETQINENKEIQDASYIQQKNLKNTSYYIYGINKSTPNNYNNVSINSKNGCLIFVKLRQSTIRNYNVIRFLCQKDGEKFFNYSFDEFELNSDNHIAPICFPKNTPIKTDQGIIEIQKINSFIHTIDSKKIVAITKTISNDDYLVCFEKDSLGKNMPCEETIMSKEHKVLYNGVLIEADHFIGKLENVKKIKYNGEDLYNVLLETHQTMNVNNMICETLHPENFVARLYNSKLSEFFKNVIFNKIDQSIHNKDTKAYKKAVHVLRKASFLKDALDNNMIRKEAPVKSQKIIGLKNMKF